MSFGLQRMNRMVYLPGKGEPYGSSFEDQFWCVSKSLLVAVGDEPGGSYLRVKLTVWFIHWSLVFHSESYGNVPSDVSTYDMPSMKMFMIERFSLCWILEVLGRTPWCTKFTSAQPNKSVMWSQNGVPTIVESTAVMTKITDDNEFKLHSYMLSSWFRQDLCTWQLICLQQVH